MPFNKQRIAALLAAKAKNTLPSLPPAAPSMSATPPLLTPKVSPMGANMAPPGMPKLPTMGRFSGLKLKLKR